MGDSDIEIYIKVVVSLMILGGLWGLVAAGDKGCDWFGIGCPHYEDVPAEYQPGYSEYPF